MIIVSVILLSAQDGQSQELARMVICNMGTGTANTGNYSAETLRGRSTEDFARRTRQRIAYVANHPRKREHVWNLVAKCLRNLRYGGDWNEGAQASFDSETSQHLRPTITAARDGTADWTAIADQVVPEYRLAPGHSAYSCTGQVARRWQAAWDAACLAQGGNPNDYRNSRTVTPPTQGDA